MSNQFCGKCGSAIPEGAAFCPNCGESVQSAPAAQQQPVYQQPRYQEPVYQQVANVGAQPNLLVFGILSIVFDWIFVGIILAAVGRSKGKAYVAQGGQLTGASKVGFILCKVGLILSIIGTIGFAISLIVYIAVLAGGAATIRYY